MTETITRNSSPTVAITMLASVDYEAEYQPTTIIHPQLHGASYNITYLPVRDRSGTLTLLFNTSSDAWAAVALLRTAYNFTWASDVTGLSMTFVVAGGSLQPTLNDTRKVWTVDVPYQEVN